MTPAHVREAIVEAQRFVKLAKLIEFTNATIADGKTKYEYVTAGPPCAAARRASLDLTKALARMRAYP